METRAESRLLLLRSAKRGLFKINSQHSPTCLCYHIFREWKSWRPDKNLAFCCYDKAFEPKQLISEARLSYKVRPLQERARETDGSAEKEPEQAGPELLPDQMTYLILQGVESGHVLSRFYANVSLPVCRIGGGGQSRDEMMMRVASRSGACCVDFISHGELFSRLCKRLQPDCGGGCCLK